MIGMIQKKFGSETKEVPGSLELRVTKISRLLHDSKENLNSLKKQKKLFGNSKIPKKQRFI